MQVVKTPYTFPIKGDISREDAVILAHAVCNKTVLEAGMGGSTLIMSAFGGSGKLTSLEDKKEWYKRTSRNVRLYKSKDALDITPKLILTQDMKGWIEDQTSEFDVAFIDCNKDFRLEVSLAAWEKLVLGGKLIIHDGRAQFGMDLTGSLCKELLRRKTLDSIVFCPDNSNCVIFTKRVQKARRYNWNRTQKENNRIDWRDADEVGALVTPRKK